MYVISRYSERPAPYGHTRVPGKSGTSPEDDVFVFCRPRLHQHWRALQVPRLPTAEAAEMIDVATTRRHNRLIRCLPPTTDHRHADTGNSVVVVRGFTTL